MKTILLTTALLLGTILHAQNWELFKANETYNFNFAQIHGVRIDAISIQGNETTFHFNRILNDTVHQNTLGAQYPIQDITQPNIFGEQAIRRNDSLIFKNQFGFLLYVKPFAPINNSWNFIQLAAARIEATIDSVYTDSINQVLDSIKRVSFQYFDSLNNPIHHSINAKKMIFSKANGVVSTFNLYENAVGQSINLNYKKQYNQIFRSTTFTNSEVFDLNVGDEYHFSYSNNAPGTSPGYDIRNHIVIGRTISPNGDTVRIQLLEHRERQTSVVDYTTNPPSIVYTTTYSNRTFTKSYLYQNAVFNSKIGFEVSTSTDSILNFYDTIATTTGYSYYLPYYNTNTYNNRITINPENQIFAYDSIQSSWIVDYYLINPYSMYYLVGIFDFSNYWNNQSGGSGYPEYYSMLYFKKGTETWGTPRLVTGIDNVQSNKKKTLIYPNPAQNELYLETEDPTAFRNYEIVDLKGRFVEQGIFSNRLNIEQLKSGIYFIKLIRNENTEVLKFIKQ